MAEDILKIQDLCIDFPMRGHCFCATKGVSFSVKSGEIVGVVGESGAGKSTLGNAIISLLPPPGKIADGKIFFAGKDISSYTKEEDFRRLRGHEIGFIFQNPMSSLNPLLTVGEQLIETMLAHLSITKKEARRRGIDLLKQVGISHSEERFNQYPHQFSGGMRQRVVIAIALCCDPKLIIADEITTALDVSVQDQILNLIGKLCKDRQVGVLLITHDMGVIANITDRIVVMYKGQVVEQGATKSILTNPRHAYTKNLIAAVPPSKKRLKRFTSVDYIEDGDASCVNIKKHPLKFQNSVSVDSDQILKLRNVTLEFTIKDAWLKKNRKIVRANDNISLEINAGESFGLVGESGSGKSTLARVICGLYRQTSGEALYRGMDLNRLSKRQALPYRREISVIFQDPYSALNPRKNVFQIIAEPMFYHKLLPKDQVASTVSDLLDYVGLGRSAKNKYPHEFSGGQQQRISIARALTCSPKFLICDEPTSALDVSVQAKILNLLKDLQEELNLTLLFITHDLPVVRQVCDKIAIMKSGKIIEVGENEQIFSSPRAPYTSELLSLMPALDNAFPEVA